jgi:hypothetical protein
MGASHSKPGNQGLCGEIRHQEQKYRIGCLYKGDEKMAANNMVATVNTVLTGIGHLITEEDGNWIFNPEGTGGEDVLQDVEAGRAAKGLRLWLENRYEGIIVPSESDPNNVRYVYDRRARGGPKMVEEKRRPGMGGSNWQRTGRIDPGYEHEAGSGQATHQITSHLACLLYAHKDLRLIIPVNEKFRNAVNREIELSQTPESERPAVIAKYVAMGELAFF